MERTFFCRKLELHQPARRRRTVAVAIAAVALLVATFATTAAKSKRENVHRPDADCASCHTADRARLEREAATARGLLVSDIDARCNACHADEGPSHRTGMPPHRPVPETLPLSGSGVITCGTCHFVHGERESVREFLRIDNSRGGLCLTCHELAELQ